MLSKIDGLFWRVIDGLVTWLWNELGVPYRQLCLAMVALASVLNAARVHNWLFALLWPMAFAPSLLRTVTMPPEAITAGNIIWRSSWFAWVIRGFWIAVVVPVDVFVGWKSALTDASWLVTMLVFDAAIPTKPRVRKRQEAPVKLAWSPAR